MTEALDVAPEIHDDELVYRHIPGSSFFQAPGPRITSNNFRLRQHANESGISVSRAQFGTAEQLIDRLGGDKEKGSKVAAARVRDIRQMGLDVIAVPLIDDAGHAEIRSSSAKLSDPTIPKRLAQLFQFVEA